MESYIPIPTGTSRASADLKHAFRRAHDRAAAFPLSIQSWRNSALDPGHRNEDVTFDDDLLWRGHRSRCVEKGPQSKSPLENGCCFGERYGGVWKPMWLKAVTPRLGSLRYILLHRAWVGGCIGDDPIAEPASVHFAPFCADEVEKGY